MVFTPVFFASVGMKTNLRDMNSGILVFALLLVLAAVLSKIVGCGLGGLVCRMSRHQSLVVGIGKTTGSSLRLRSEPSLEASVITMLDKDWIIAVLGEEDGWYHVAHNGQIGYVSADFFTKDEATELNTMAGSTPGASTSGPRATYRPKSSTTWD